MNGDSEEKTRDLKVVAQGKTEKSKEILEPKSESSFPKIFKPGEPWY